MMPSRTDTRPSRREQLERRWGRDGMTRYRERVRARVRPGDRILHVGCGWDKAHITEPYRTTCEVVGLDPDPSVADRFHSRLVQGTAESMPFPSDAFDVVLCEYVLEHVRDGEDTMREIARVLRPGGTFVALTPNLYSYKSLAARVTPHRAHQWLNETLRGFSEDDIYPTHFQCNTRHDITRAATQAGLVVDEIEYVNNGPTWFVKIPGLFEVFSAFHMLLDRRDDLAFLRCNLLFETHKPEGR